MANRQFNSTKPVEMCDVCGRSNNHIQKLKQIFKIYDKGKKKERKMKMKKKEEIIYYLNFRQTPLFYA